MINIGAVYLGDHSCRFRVWAPAAELVELHLLDGSERMLPLNRRDRGYYSLTVDQVPPGTRYRYRLDGSKEFPDPASRYQPDGVHGPSQVVDPTFDWQDHAWRGIPLADFIIYELHVGTFTTEGTFEAIIPHLAGLKEIGINAVEIMPVSQFPGERNWGYDGAYPFAVQNSYGGPEGFKRLVDACHQEGLAVVLDVVYNHLGPEGCYFQEYGPYLTGRYQSPWGSALNFDGPYSDQVRQLFIQNAVYWMSEFHVDGLRLDAVHAILDPLARPFLEELAEAVDAQAEQLNRRIYLIAESDLNNPRLIRPTAVGGYGLDAQWNDDFHHALEALLLGQQSPYYGDFGRLQDLAKSFRDGYVFTGQYAPSRKRRHGYPTFNVRGSQFVVFLQNHDQIGNRPLGQRLDSMISLEELKLATALMMLSPFIPLLFMGQEYSDPSPFFYFTSHSDPALVEAVRQGRQEEFARFTKEGTLPDPQDEATFERSCLNHELRSHNHHRMMTALYQELIRLRRDVKVLANMSLKEVESRTWEREQILFVRRGHQDRQAVVIASFNRAEVTLHLPVPAGQWQCQLNTSDERWLGLGSRLPEIIHSEGMVELVIPPQACLLLVWTAEE